MPIQECFPNPLMKSLAIFIVAASVTVACFHHPVNGLESRKLDEPGGGDQSIKCNPSCIQSPLPPSPPPPAPCPPPPALPPPTPPAPKKPPTQYCPPPPSSYIYITGPPGNLYPIDRDFSGATASQTIPSSLPLLLVAAGISGLLVFWWS